MNAENNALTIPQRAAIALNSTKTEAELHALVKASADIVEVKDNAGREQVHRMGMNLKNARITIEKTRKAACEDAQAFSKGCIAEEKRLVAIVSLEEDRVFGLRDAYDAKLEAEKQAKLAAERARIAAIEARIYALSDFPRVLQYEDTRQLLESLPIAIAEYEAMEPSEELFQEFVPRAKDAALNTLEILRALLIREQQKAEAARIEREQKEAEATRMAAEREEMARQKAELDQRAAEQAAAQKRLEAERQQREAEEKERQRVAAETKRQLEAQQAAIAEERRKAEAEIAQARAKLEAEEAAAKVAQEAALILARDHEEALAMNAAFDAARLAADHAEALEMDAIFNDHVTALQMDIEFNAQAYYDEILDSVDVEPTDQEIIKAYIETFGGTEEIAVARLLRFGKKE